MSNRLEELLACDRFGRYSVRLPAFAGWGTDWQVSGTDDRPPAARAGVFPLAIDADPGGAASDAQRRAVERLVSEQAAIAERVAVALGDHLRQFAGVPDPADSSAGVCGAVLLSGVRVYDPRVDPRNERGGCAVLGLGFSSEWCGHTADHGIEAVVCGAEVVHVGDQGTF